MDAAALVDRHEVAAKLRALDVLLEVLLEEVVVQLIGRGKLSAIEFFQALERRDRVLFAFVDRFQALIAPTIVPAAVAHRRSAHRALFHFVVPFRFEKFIERFAGVPGFSEGDAGDEQGKKESE